MNEKILDQISGNYKIVLLTTFNYDLDYFDNQILYKFLSNKIKDISVFVDREQLQQSLNKQKTNLGVMYSVIPFKMNKSFHPKIILLLDDFKAKLIVGSSNLTEKGYSSNQEIFNYFEYDKDNQDNLNLIIDAYNFFKRLIELSNEKDNEILNKINDISYLKRTNVDGKIKFIDNLDDSIYNKTMKYINKEIKSIDIAVPYYDNDASALNYIEENHSNTKIKLYIQNEKSTFPQKLYTKYENNIFKFKNVKCNECGNFYHGKVFRFITDDESYILYGSANCTNAAFLKSFNDKGNVECDILEKGSIHEFDDLFLQFEEDNTTFSSYPIIDNISSNKYNFSLEELIKKDDIKCILNYNEIVNKLLIYINNKESKECEYIYDNNKLIVTIPEIVVKEIGNVFQLKIVNQSNNEESIINCFYNDYEAISLYRNADDTDKNVAKKILLTNDIFINDIIDLMYQIPKNTVDIQNLNDNRKKYIEQRKDIEEASTDEEYIIDEELLLEYKKKYDEDKLINEACHKIGNMYYKTIKDIINFDDDPYTPRQKNNISDKDKNKDNIENLEISDEELEIFNRRKGKRIIKKIISGIVTNDYKEKVNYYDYKAYIGLLNFFLDKYTDYRSKNDILLANDNKNEYLFEYKDSAALKFKLASSLVDLLNEEINLIEEKDDVILMTFQSIIQEFYTSEEYELQDNYFRSSVEKLIKKLDDLYHIRDTYIKYVIQALTIVNTHKETFSDGLCIGKFEGLFKYKSLKGIINLINFKEEHLVTKTNNTVILEIKTTETISFVNIKLELLKKELNIYFKGKYNLIDNIDAFIIIVSNPNVDLSKYDPVIKIRLIWNNLSYRKIKDTKLNSDIIEEIIKW